MGVALRRTEGIHTVVYGTVCDGVWLVVFFFFFFTCLNPGMIFTCLNLGMERSNITRCDDEPYFFINN